MWEGIKLFVYSIIKTIVGLSEAIIEVYPIYSKIKKIFKYLSLGIVISVVISCPLYFLLKKIKRRKKD